MSERKQRGGREQISVPLPADLRDEIELAAATDRRTVAGWVRCLILDALAARHGQEAAS
jgi:hypothetical protein